MAILRGNVVMEFVVELRRMRDVLLLSANTDW